MLRHITRCVVVAIETKQALLRTLPTKNARDAGTRMGTGGAVQCVLIDFRIFDIFYRITQLILATNESQPAACLQAPPPAAASSSASSIPD